MIGKRAEPGWTRGKAGLDSGSWRVGLVRDRPVGV